MLLVLKWRPKRRQSHNVWVKACSASNSKTKPCEGERGSVNRKLRKEKSHHRPDGRRASRPATSKDLARDQRLL